MQKNVVLVVDDDCESLEKTWSWAMNGYKLPYELVYAPNKDQARQLFRQHRNDILLVIMDGKLEKSSKPEVDTVDIITEFIGQVPDLHIIATTSIPGLERQKMMDAGCREHVEKGKVPKWLHRQHSEQAA